MTAFTATALPEEQDHSREIAKRLDGEKGGRLVAIDRDPEAVKTATERLAGYPATL